MSATVVAAFVDQRKPFWRLQANDLVRPRDYTEDELEQVDHTSAIQSSSALGPAEYRRRKAEPSLVSKGSTGRDCRGEGGGGGTLSVSV